MNGPHDLGGPMGVGPGAPEKDGPSFHARWGRRGLRAT
ncbi:nitrile hydratase subunit beta, partial [Mesorhizobium sp. M7A.F.Ca.CA.004.04.2.1]